MDAVKKLDNHPTVEEVYADVIKDYNNISKNTVYRNLRQLADDGEIQRVQMQGEPERYDNNSKKHYHFKCNICGMMIDIDMDYIDDIDKTARFSHKFKIDGHDIIFKGTCLECSDT